MPDVVTTASARTDPPGSATATTLPRRWVATFLGVSAADVVLTAVVLAFGGFEANPLAAAVYARLGLPGLAGLKLAVVVAALAAARAIARRRRPTARRLLVAGVVLSALPVMWSTAVIVRRSAHAWFCDVCGWHNGF